MKLNMCGEHRTSIQIRIRISYESTSTLNTRLNNFSLPNAYRFFQSLLSFKFFYHSHMTESWNFSEYGKFRYKLLSIFFNFTTKNAKSLSRENLRKLIRFETKTTETHYFITCACLSSSFADHCFMLII